MSENANKNGVRPPAGYPELSTPINVPEADTRRHRPEYVRWQCPRCLCWNEGKTCDGGCGAEYLSEAERMKLTAGGTT